MRYQLLCGLLIASVELWASPFPDGPKSLLDSARFMQYKDYAAAMNLCDQAEKKLRLEGLTNKAAVDILRVRITTTRYFDHYTLNRQYLQQAKDLISSSENELGTEYQTLSIENENAWAQYFYKTDNYGRALAIFNSLIEKLKKIEQNADNCLLAYSSIQYVAAIQLATGEYEASINQYLASIPYYECYRDKKKPPNHSLVYRNIGQAYLAKGDVHEARSYFARAAQSLATYIKDPQAEQLVFRERSVVLAETMAVYYRKVNQPDSALATFLPIKKLLDKDFPLKGRAYGGLAEAYGGVGKFVEAQEYYSLAKSFFQKTFGPRNLPLAKLYLAEGNTAEKQVDYEKALKCYQLSIENNVVDFDLTRSDNPALKNIVSKKQLFLSLDKKSRLLWKLYQMKSDSATLFRAWRTNKLSVALLDSTAREFGLSEDKVILAEQSFATFEDGIRMAYELYTRTKDKRYLDECFFLVDKSKGVVLLENLRLVNSYAGVDPSLIDQEKMLRSELLQTEQALYKQEAKGAQSPESFTIRERYAKVKQDYTAWIAKTRTELPSYYKLRFNHPVLTRNTVRQELLEPGETLVEYFLGDSTLTIFRISTDADYTSQVKVPGDFYERVERFRELLSSSDPSRPKAEFNKLSDYFYNLLLADCLANISEGTKSLIIIPDGILGYIPFDVLKPVGDKDFLVQKFAVSYGYSASSLHEQLLVTASRAEHLFAGFVAAGKNTNSELKEAKTETESIINLLGSGTALYEPALKSDFVNNAPHYKVLHLAMHSELNDKKPMLSELVFATDSGNVDGRLTAIELYNMQLNADMAVLSACNTGSGKMQRGEGIMSLSRAFAFAGVPSAVMSLWQVPDKATARLMVNYYKHLSRGLEKNEALRQAKIDFVRENASMTEPYYWSGFILTGNKRPITFPIHTSWLLFAGAAFILMLLYAARNRMRRDVQPQSISSAPNV